MHDLTPLGILTHLKELDREAIAELHPVQAGTRDASPVTGVRAAMATLLRRLLAVGIPEQAASQGKSHS